MAAESCALVVLVLVIVVLPMVFAIVAIARGAALRRHVDELERDWKRGATRLSEFSDRLKRLEAGRPPEVPSPSPIPSPPAIAPAPASPPPPPRAEPVAIRPEVREVLFPVPPPTGLLPANAPVAKKPKERVSVENMIGERILPRVGVVALVLGLGLLVWYSYAELGPAGRLTLTSTIGAAMTVGGVFLRRRVPLKLLGGCLIGGGWAVMYITAYASHFIPASRVVASPLAGFLILLGVSGAALVHALKYRNETIAGLAYLLTIVTLFLSPEPGPAAWLAMSLSGAVLVTLAWRERWIRLCAFGAALLYITEGIWLANTPPGDLIPAFAVLVALWIMWILPDYFHRPATAETKGVHGALVAINFAGLLVVGGLIQAWFGVRSMGAIWMTLGALYAVHAIVGCKFAWRPAHLGALAFAAALAGLGSHQQFQGTGPVLAWTGISTALFAWGLWRKDRFPRLMGIVAVVVTVSRFWTLDRNLDYAFIPAILLAALLYAFSAAVARIRRGAPEVDFESSLVDLLAHLGALALALVIWHYPSELTVAILFAVTGLLLLELGPRLGASALVPEAACFLTVALFFVASVNLSATGEVYGVSRRLASTVPVLLAWLYAGEAFPMADPNAKQFRAFFAVLLFAGLLSLLRFELGAPAAPVAWAVATGAWVLWSRLARRDLEFILAGAGAAATVLVYSATSTLRVPALGWEGPVGSGALILVIFVAAHLATRRGVPAGLPSWARDLFAAAMSVTGFVLLAREMSGTWLTGSWAILGFALAGYGFIVRDRISRWSSLLVLGVCLGKVAIFDLATFDMPVKIATLVTLGGVMLAMSFVYARHHRRILGYFAGKE